MSEDSEYPPVSPDSMTLNSPSRNGVTLDITSRPRRTTLPRPYTDAPRPHAEPAYSTEHPLLAHPTFLPHPRSRHD
eukprot:2836560-Rhodomonas_salina.1